MLGVYVLTCRVGDTDGYYVGRTTDLSERIHNHARGTGAEWTADHDVVGIDGMFRHRYNRPSGVDGRSSDQGLDRIESFVAGCYVTRYSIDRVRGASYTKRRRSPGLLQITHAFERAIDGTRFDWMLDHVDGYRDPYYAPESSVDVDRCPSWDVFVGPPIPNR